MSIYVNNHTICDAESAEVIRMFNSILKNPSVLSKGSRFNFDDSHIYCHEVVDEWLHGMLKKFDRQVDIVSARFQNVGGKDFSESDLQLKAEFDAGVAIIRLCCEFYPIFLARSIAPDKDIMRVPFDLLLRLITLYDDGFAGKINTRGMLATAQAFLAKDDYNIADVGQLKVFPK